MILIHNPLDDNLILYAGLSKKFNGSFDAFTEALIINPWLKLYNSDTSLFQFRCHGDVELFLHDSLFGLYILPA